MKDFNEKSFFIGVLAGSVVTVILMHFFPIKKGAGMPAVVNDNSNKIKGVKQ